MIKKYLSICLLLLCFFSEAICQTTDQPLSRKERRALKKQSKNTPTKATTAQEESVKSIIEQMQQITTPKPVPNATEPVPTATTVSVEEIIKNPQELVIEQANGAINWTQQYIEATGQSVIDNERFKNPAQARLMAQRGAIVVAQRNLLEIVKGVHIIGETTVQDMITTSDVILSKVDGVIKGAQQVGESIEKNGYIEVRLRMPLYGQKSLANTLDNTALRQIQAKNGLELSNLLNQAEIGEGIDGSNPIFFNIENGETLDPSLFPIIVDDQGKVLFDFSKIYSLKEGKFPQYLQLGKDVMQALGNQKAVDIINMIQTGKGQFKIPEKSSKNVFWRKVANIAQNVGSALFRIIF